MARTREENRIMCREYYYRNREAQKIKKREYEIKNKAKMVAARKAWDKANPEKVKAIRQGINKRFYAKNKAQQRQRARDYAANNREKHRAKAMKWAADHPAEVRAIKHRRNARKSSQLHPDLDRAAERAIFAKSQRLTKETGILHHIDHIIPLDCGGWHHHDNLQVLPGPINISKGADPFWEREGFKSWKDVPRHLWPESLVPAYEVRAMI